MDREEDMRRPLGITIIAILLFIGAILGIVTGLMSLGVFGASSNAPAGVVTLVLAVIQFIVALGLWRLAKWAWSVAVIVVVLRVAAEIWALVAGAGLAAVIVSLVINVIILLYLMSGGVRSAFR